MNNMHENESFDVDELDFGDDPNYFNELPSYNDLKSRVLLLEGVMVGVLCYLKAVMRGDSTIQEETASELIERKWMNSLRKLENGESLTDDDFEFYSIMRKYISHVRKRSENHCKKASGAGFGLMPGDLGILHHTLGIKDPKQEESYRNRFIAGDGHQDMPRIKRLIDAGFMEEAKKPEFLGKSDKLFVCTEKGFYKAMETRPK